MHFRKTNPHHYNTPSLTLEKKRLPGSIDG